MGEAVSNESNKPLEQVVADIRVLVKLDRMEATIEVTIPPGSPGVTMTQLEDKLKDGGIIYGIDDQALDRLSKARSSLYTCCARGLPPCNGEDAYLKYHVDLESQGRPVEMEDGRVDFKNINNFICVEEGQLLVEKIPRTLGVEGVDVLGLPVPAKPGKDIPWPIGKNVIVADNRLVSRIAGQLHIAHNRVNVLPVLEIDGDVDYSTGNIDFVGSVIVRGSILSGFTVKAAGNVEIRGSVDGGTVEGHNITVSLGIKGMNRSVIRARERLVARFIENATVYADKEVGISDVVMHSKVYAGLKIIVHGRLGLVLGGRLSAGEEIRVHTVGSLAQAATDLEVSINPFLKDELIKLRGEIKEKVALREELERSLTYIRSSGVENLPASKRERYDKMEVEYNALPEYLEDMRLRLADIESLIYSLKPGKILVSNIVYPGVKVHIGSLSRTISDPLKYLTLYAHDQEIKFTSFR
ncbi:MAG: FapA family protein [Negativicutes bacterium]|nr:FapA family protein [Negativicutes bacterium]